MDPVTHMLAGAGLGRAGLEEKYGKGTVLELALLSELPDIDQLVLMFTGGPFYIMDRRTLAHSVVGIPILCLAAAAIYRKLRPAASFKDHFVLGLIACTLHISMDLVNSFGVAFLFPLDNRRFEFSTVFIIDLMLTGLLVAPFLLGLIPRLRDSRKKLARGFLAAAAAYVALCFGARASAASLLPQPGGYVFPEPFGPTRWRGVVRSGDDRLVYLLEPFKQLASWRRTDHSDELDPAVIKVKEEALAKKLLWFYKEPVWKVERKDGKPVAVYVYDLRFESLLLENKPSFGCRFELDEAGTVTKAYWSSR